MYDLGLVRAIGEKEVDIEPHRHTRNAIVSAPNAVSTLRILSLDSSEFAINGKHKEIDIISVSPKHQLVFAATNSGHILIWKVNLLDANPIKLVSMSKPHSEMILRINVSPDESYFSTSSKDGTSKIWNIPDWWQLETLVNFTTNCIWNWENIKALT